MHRSSRLLSPLALLLALFASTLAHSEAATAVTASPAGTTDPEVARLRRDLADARAQLDALRADSDARLKALEARIGQVAPSAASMPVVAVAPPPAAAPADAAADAALQAEIAQALAQDTAATAPAPKPAGAGTGGGGGGGGTMRLLDVSLDGLFAAGTSSVDDAAIQALQKGDHDPHERGFTVQNVELSFLAAVDPYLKGESHVVMSLSPEGETKLELEEAFLTTQALPHGLQLKAGQFFHEFGRLNPTHPHAWAFVDQPVVSGRMFGPDGLRGPGVRLSWLTPAPWYSEILTTVQKSRGGTAYSFYSSKDNGSFGGHPLGDAHVKSAEDLLMSVRWLNSLTVSPQTTLNLGASALFGPNSTGSDTRTRILGVDAYLKWRAASNDKGWPFVAWQTEAMKREYQAGAFVDPLSAVTHPRETLRDWGAYTQLTWGFRPGWTAGLRLEHADGNDAEAEDRRLDPDRDRRTRESAALTYYPSEFSKIRFQLNHDTAQFLDAAGHDGATSFWIQWEFTMGAHGAHSF